MDVIRFLIDFILHIDVHLAELVAQYGVCSSFCSVKPAL